jgi:hypothetical protein
MADVNVNWVLPTTRTSGKPLNPADIAAMELALSIDGTNFTPFDSYTRDILSTVVTELEPGDWYFRGVVVDTLNRRSLPRVSSINIPDLTPPGALLALNLSL